MENQELTKIMKNEVFQLIENNGLDPTEFEWYVVTSNHNVDLQVSRLIHENTGYFFDFDFKRGSHWSKFSPGIGRRIEEEYPGSWDLQLDNCRLWLSQLNAEKTAPDLWNQLPTYHITENVQIDPGVGNEPFSAFHADQILKGIEEIKSYLKDEAEIEKHFLSQANEKLDDLADATKRLGRKDWFHKAVGVINIVSTLLKLNPDQIVIVVNILKEQLTGIIPLLIQ
ncbi:hypothetical protein ACFLQJ_00490 [Calditrichota bacterium]